MKIGKIGIVRKYYRTIKPILEDVKKAGFRHSQEDPDVVLCIGGDGTYLTAERLYPSIPKILIRESHTCRKCEDASVMAILDRLKKGDFRIEEHSKLEARISGRKRVLLASNDIVIRNRLVTRAIRFNVSVDRKPIGDTIIGDGIIASTPFGSEAYFFSVAKTTFSKGFGLALNNPTIPREPLLLGKSSEVLVELARNAAFVSADNDPYFTTVHPGDRITIRLSSKKARILRFYR